MKKLIMIKYGELSTKKDNINYFLKLLKTDIEAALTGMEVSIRYDRGRMFVDPLENDFEIVAKKIQNVFGIHEILIVYEIPSTDIEVIKESLKELIKGYSFETFKVETKRSDKNYPMTSVEISKVLGGVVLKNMEDVKVDVHEPKTIIYAEVRQDKSYLSFECLKGIGGYPVGSLGKGLLMLSGGIDSPVAGYLALKRGVRIEAIYFDAPPHTSEAAKNKVIKLAKVLSTYSSYVKIHVINFTKMEETILKKCPRDYLITIMRRMMYRISERIANKNNCKCIVNGESIGQVASQTLTSMYAINQVVTIPTIRPVACLDKLETIDLAEKIGTYKISIEPFEDCCTIFVPDHPVINPDPALCEEYETAFDYEELIRECIRTETVVKVDNSIDEKHVSIL
jgi:thiamine biosynthesis protein ThiI